MSRIKFKKENIRLRISIYNEGEWNLHEYVKKFDFCEAIKLFTALYLGTGILPQFGDSFYATDKSVYPNNYHFEFYIIGRSFFIDDYSEIQLLAVEEKDYHILKHYSKTQIR